ncbi:extracellular signal-regulated protein kinase [Dictyostelium purpureum]|uniref:Mitogen-activated protein kinase n=1 Tax=Dictyostelium purpureum TaxID=5786 RepID=F0ZDG1_DICPU|nr:extracellular signal-regulated protein kinase [Dictyostelium purpureum]EGC38039.1 extracellular signal-regulated protein kinase [Dictyostelium purpureum]|eukprot:XP_003285440.1 extracellular signal-regulated protein kinase [Dictyostelium purpureum]
MPPPPPINDSSNYNENISYFVYGSQFTVPRRYSIVKCIGHGAYGVVCSARDNLTGEKVAIKKISKAFDNLKDTKRTLREIHLLRHFKHENLISVKDILKPNSKDTFDDVYLVSELMDTDLHQIISSPQPLSDDHCQYFVYQMLRGLKHIHSANVLHRDLKPSNLLINEDCLLKICDLGLARVEDATHQGFMTEYVATRWYRAPEVILSWNKYTKAIDIWSVGCIFAELLGRKPLFQGKDYIHQITLIIETIGSPSEEDISNIANEQARQFIRNMGYVPKVNFANLFPKANPDAINLLERMLCFDPNKRLTVEDALSHPYFSTLHDPSDEPICLHKFNLSFESWDLNRELLKELIYNEMLYYHPDPNDSTMVYTDLNNPAFNIQSFQNNSNDLFNLFQQQKFQLQQQIKN